MPFCDTEAMQEHLLEISGAVASDAHAVLILERAGWHLAGALIESLGLVGHLEKHPDQLSGGERQRVAVARALANDPPLVLADEPTGSLDSKSTEQVFAILQALVRERGKTIIAVTHDTGLAGRMDRRLELNDGRLIADVWQQREGAPGPVETTWP